MVDEDEEDVVGVIWYVKERWLLLFVFKCIVESILMFDL